MVISPSCPKETFGNARIPVTTRINRTGFRRASSNFATGHYVRMPVAAIVEQEGHKTSEVVEVRMVDDVARLSLGCDQSGLFESRKVKRSAGR